MTSPSHGPQAASTVSAIRALALPATPLAVIDEPGLDDRDRLQLMGLTGYFTSRTSEQLAAKVHEVLASRASQGLKEAMLEALESHMRVDGVTSIRPFLPVPSSSSSSSSSSSTTTSPLR